MKKSIELSSGKHLTNLWKLIWTGVCICIISPIYAQVPEGFNYQAVLRDGNNLLNNQIVDVRFTFLMGGTEIYQENQNLTTDSRGMIHTVIGTGTPLLGSFSDIPWDSGLIDLKVSVDAGGGFVNLGTTSLSSVPYSFHAQHVADISDHSLSDLADVSLGSPSTGDVMSWDGSNWTNQSQFQPWSGNSSSIHYDGLSVGIRTSSPTSTLTVRGNVDLLDIPTHDRKMRMYGSTVGAIDFNGASGSRNALIGYTSGNQDYGFMGVYNATSQPRAYMEIVANTGRIIARGPADTRNAVMTWLSGCNDCGYVSVYDANSQEAGMYVNTSGQGIVFGDIKNFRMEHPTQEGKEIWYASLEGPEAGAYERGTAKLVNGQATVSLSDHFALVAATEGLTVILTPLSGASKGLAVTQKSNTGFEVTELYHGNGNYEFDWEIKAVRKGFEDYRVIRDADEARPGGSRESEILHAQQPGKLPAGN